MAPPTWTWITRCAGMSMSRPRIFGALHVGKPCRRRRSDRQEATDLIDVMMLHIHRVLVEPVHTREGVA
jgi:hypothetical protein